MEEEQARRVKELSALSGDEIERRVAVSNKLTECAERATSITQTNQGADTPSLSLIHSLSLTHSLSLSLTHPLTHSLTHPLSLTQPTLTHSPTLTYSSTHSHSLTHSLTHPLSHSLSFSPLAGSRRHAFLCRHQESGEDIAEFVANLKRLIVPCNYSVEFQKTILRDRFVCGLVNESTRKRLLTEENKLTFEEAIAIAIAVEKATTQARLMKAESKTSCTSSTSSISQFLRRSKTVPYLLQMWRSTSCNCLQIHP